MAKTEKTEEQKAAFRKRMAEAKAMKAKQAELPAMPPKAKKARKPKARKSIEPGEYPPGFGAKERKLKIERAIAAVRKAYPAMDAMQVREYLCEVGAGRTLALYNYEPGPRK